MLQHTRTRVLCALLFATLVVSQGCGSSPSSPAKGTGGFAQTGSGGAKGGAGGANSGGNNGGNSGGNSGGSTGPGASATGGTTTGPTGGTGGGSTGATTSTGGTSIGAGGTSGTGGTTATSTGGTKGGAGGGSGGVATGGSQGSGTGGATGGTSANATGGATGATGGSTGTGGSGGSSVRDAAVDAYVLMDANLGSDAVLDTRAGDAASIPGTNNPVLVGYNADPNVVLFDNTFYIFPTTDGFASWGSTSFSVFSSTNLVQWTNRGVILDLTKDLKWATGHGWAPSIARVGTTYYFYFSADSQIGVATSSSPTGPFKDALGKALATTGQYGSQSIDPYVFIDDDGTPYLYFGSGSGGLRLAKLNADMISFAATPTNISPSGASGTLEGSAMFKRKGTYYLAWSEGDTRNATYQMAYARAQSPQGPFTRLAVILQQNTTLGILGPGGGTILALPSRDEYYLAYHRFKIPGGDGTHRETCIDRMAFNSDGTIVPVKPTLEGLQTAVSP
ncbi:MAG TPA: family 43 glycosylhydrolase [Polyangia bacterium]